MKKLKLYKVVADNSEVMAVSLVDEPAIDLNFIHLHKETPQLICLEKDEKHLLVGCVLRPDYPIYRNNGKEEFYLEFPKETVERLAYDYMQSGRIYSFTTDHKDIADNVSIVESWIKTSENDKSKDYGLDVPIGSWIICAKVEDEAIWKRVKDGELRGFSVESFVNLEEIILSKENSETNMTEEVKLETIEVTEGFWMRIAEVIKAALKSPECAELEAQVTSAQVIDEMKQEVASTEEEVIETPIEEPVVEEPIVEEEVITEEPTVAEEVTEEVVSESTTEEEVKEDLQAVIDELNAKIDELNQELAKLQIENQKLSKQPSAKPINMKSETAQGSNFDRMLAIMNGSAFKK